MHRWEGLTLDLNVSPTVIPRATMPRGIADLEICKLRMDKEHNIVAASLISLNAFCLVFKCKHTACFTLTPVTHLRVALVGAKNPCIIPLGRVPFFSMRTSSAKKIPLPGTGINRTNVNASFRIYHSSMLVQSVAWNKLHMQ
jgi:hypothetical protein